MNREETKQILMAIRAIFQSFNVTGETVSVWETVLSPHDYTPISEALMQYLSSAEKFPPTPGQLIQIAIKKVKGKNKLGSDDAWRLVLAASSRYAEDRRAALPPALSQLGTRIGWERMEMADTLTELPWLQKEFIRLFEREMQDREEVLAISGIRADSRLKLSSSPQVQIVPKVAEILKLAEGAK